jgi:hypothetical protein
MRRKYCFVDWHAVTRSRPWASCSGMAGPRGKSAQFFKHKTGVIKFLSSEMRRYDFGRSGASLALGLEQVSENARS